MKKLLLLLALVVIGTALFADDALVLPKGVMRVRLTNTYAFMDQAYDDSGSLQDDREVKMDILGAAFELGMTDQITLGIQWAPGYTVWSEIEGVDDGKLTGVHHLYLGTKIQLLGEKAFIPSEKMRFTVTPGVRIPLQKYDVESEFTNYSTGKEYQLDSVDNEAWGIGGRLKFDYLFTDSFYLNLYTEMIYNLPTKRNLDIGSAGGLYPVIGSAAFGDFEYEYGLDALFEIDPHYDWSITEGHTLSFSLPTRYTYIPELTVEGDAIPNSGGYMVTLTPTLNYFNTSSMIPWEASIDYSIPVMGKNASRTNTITFQLKLYAQLFGF